MKDFYNSNKKIEKLTDLPNIGPELEKQLNQVGITDYDQLKTIGSEEAWLKIKSIDPSACIHRLYALEGAICKIKKNFIEKERKQELSEFYKNNKSI